MCLANDFNGYGCNISVFVISYFYVTYFIARLLFWLAHFVSPPSIFVLILYHYVAIKSNDFTHFFKNILIIFENFPALVSVLIDRTEFFL
ncbi:MAG TPA: hypothetical protein DEV87_06455 [Clostridiales bacterium]|nr:hypothetical protein [Clostridiales bacterium]